MATKRPKTTPTRDDVVNAALKLAAKRDWGLVTLADIARGAGITLADLSAMFESREDIVATYSRMIDREVLDSYPDGVPGNEDKDQLFEVLMERFDRLNDDRAALSSIIRASCADPKQIIVTLPGIARSMNWTLEACGIDTNGWKGAARVLALSGIFMWCLRTWKDDDSQDMSKTMAALDRGLDRFASLPL